MSPEQRGGGSSGFEPLARVGSLNFQLPRGVGHPNLKAICTQGHGTHAQRSQWDLWFSGYIAPWTHNSRFLDGSLFYVLRGWRPGVKGERSGFLRVYRHDLKLQEERKTTLF